MSSCITFERAIIGAIPHSGLPTTGLAAIITEVAGAAASARTAARLDPAWTPTSNQFALLERGLRTNDSSMMTGAFQTLLGTCQPMVQAATASAATTTTSK